MFGGGNVKLEATVTIDISKTDIPFFQTLPCLSASLSVKSSPLPLFLCISTQWSCPPLIICHSILPEPNLTNRGDNWGTRGMPPHNVYQLSVWVMPRMMILWYQWPLSLQRPSPPLCLSGTPNKVLTMKSVSGICPWDAVSFSALLSLGSKYIRLQLTMTMVGITMAITVSQSSNWHLYIACFLDTTDIKLYFC